MIRQILLRIALLAPWAFIIWLITQGIAGDVSMLLVFFLLFILIPGAIVVNIGTALAFQGHQAIKIMRDVQRGKYPGGAQKPGKLESENYADLPWWNPKKYK